MTDIPEYINLTPYRELKQGEKSIFDYVGKEDIQVTRKVVEYLQAGNAYIFSPGIYDHPFTDQKLLGPYIYCDDDRYCWDRDTWKYVVKYKLALPSEFIDYVMSDEGTIALDKLKKGETWKDSIKAWKEKPNTAVFIPDDIGDLPLDDF